MANLIVTAVATGETDEWVRSQQVGSVGEINRRKLCMYACTHAHMHTRGVQTTWQPTTRHLDRSTSYNHHALESMWCWPMSQDIILFVWRCYPLCELTRCPKIRCGQLHWQLRILLISVKQTIQENSPFCCVNNESSFITVASSCTFHAQAIFDG